MRIFKSKNKQNFAPYLQLPTLIAGGGSVAARVARMLSERGENVTLIDEDKQRCEWLSKNSDAQVYNGNILDPSILLEAGIDKADTLVVALAVDEISRKLVDLAKSQFGVPRVVAVLNSSDLKDKIKESGADKVIVSEELLFNELEGLFQTPGQKTLYLDREQDRKVTRVSVRATSELLGEKVTKISNKSAKIVAIGRGGNTVFPDDDTVLQMGDEVFLIGNEREVDKLASKVEGS